MRARIDRYRSDPPESALGGLRLPPMTDAWADELIRHAGGTHPVPSNGPRDEFAPGWPMLVVRGTDADALPPRRPGVLDALAGRTWMPETFA